MTHRLETGGFKDYALHQLSYARERLFNIQNCLSENKPEMSANVRSKLLLANISLKLAYTFPSMKTQTPRARIKSTDDTPRRILYWMCGVIVLLHLYGAIVSDAATWGFHHFGFLPTVWSVVAFFLMLFFLSSKGQSFIARALQFISNRPISLRLSSPSLYIVLVLLGALFWFARERLYFLGDGYLIVRTLPNVVKLEDVVIAFRNEPFTGLLIWRFFHLLTYLQVPSAAERSFQLVSILFGLGSVAVVLRLVQILASEKVERLMMALFILGSATTQIFFGYVEMYSPAIFGLLLYCYLAFRYLLGKTQLLFPSLAFGLLTSLYLGMLSLTPSFLFLLYHALRRRHVGQALTSVLASAALFACLILASGYTPATLWTNMTGDKTHTLALTMTSSMWQPYPLFSLWHFIDYLNINILVSPFALLLIILGLSYRWKQELWNNADWLFVGLTTISSLGFMFIVNPDLGMSRDWDLLSPFVIPSVLLACMLWFRDTEQRPSTRPVLLTILGVTIVHTAFWIVLNADADRSLARHLSLQDRRLWSKGALCNASEELAIFYRNQQDYVRAEEYFRKFLMLDSTNTRIWVSLANLHKRTKNVDGEIRAWENALHLGLNKEDAYVDLGKLYIQQQRLTDGLQLTQKALELYPNSGKLVNNLGVILFQQKNNCSDALPMFLDALAKDPTVPEAFLNAGLCYKMANDSEKMGFYWRRFLELAPEAPQAQQVRAMLAENK